MTKIIALDIDGTITASHDRIELPVIEYLHQLVDRGWTLLLVTGRTIFRTEEMLKNFSFPFYFAAQNGAQIFYMPSRQRIYCQNLSLSILSSIESYLDQGRDLVVFMGEVDKDRCFYRKERLKPELLAYMLERGKAFKEEWIAVEHFLEPIPAFKCFGKREELEIFKKNLLQSGIQLHLPVIRDPYQEGMHVALGTAAIASKGHVIKHLRRHLKDVSQVIAAGDDYNDIPMMHEADIKIVMANAPQELLQLADIIAPTAKELGIIEALEKAVSM